MPDLPFSLVIEFPVEFLGSDHPLRKLRVLIWKMAGAGDWYNGSRVIARESFTTSRFSSIKAFADGSSSYVGLCYHAVIVMPGLNVLVVYGRRC